MADQFSIQRFPEGLLDTLGMKGTGQAPGQLSPTVAPTLDLMPYYVDPQLELVLASQAGFDVNVFETIQVPANEYWLVRQIGFRAATATGTVSGSKVSLGFVPDGVAVFNMWTALQTSVSINGTSQLSEDHGYWFEKPVILRPGWFIIALCHTDATETYTLTLKAAIRRLPA